MTLSKSQCLLVLLVLLSLTFLFYPGLFFSQVPSFRDAYHFYYPQAVWLDRHSSDGEPFPAWNPQEALGTSVPAQASTGLYYPLRAVALLPWLSMPQKFTLSMLLHIVLAGVGAGYAARKCDCASSQCWLAGISYGLSCPVFFQHANQIYLFGAAWNGFALGAVIAACRNGLSKAEANLKYGIIFAFATALMLLAGDPQSAANAWLIALAAAIGRVVFALLGRREGDGNENRAVAVLKTAATFLLPVTLFVALTAIQWVPTSRLARLTTRGEPTLLHHGETRTLQELNQLVDTLPDEPHRVFAFSLSPWHALTAAFPLLGGHYQPTNARWFSLIPAEGRMWVPSIYLGIIPFLILFGVSARVRPSRKLVWLFVLAVFSFLAALGSYSVVWLVREALTKFAPELLGRLPSDGVTSVYWLLTFVPSYEGFRYPAKWTTWLVLACSLGAACKLDEAAKSSSSKLSFNRIGRSVWIGSLVLWCISGIVMLLAWMKLESIQQWENALASSDALLGRFDFDLAINLIFLSTSVTVLSSIGFRRYCQAVQGEHASGESSEFRNYGPALMTTCEMSLIACFWIYFAAEPAAGNLSRVPSSEAISSPPFVWVDLTEANLIRDVENTAQTVEGQAAYQREFLLGKLSSLTSASNLSATQSLLPSGVARLRNWLAWKDDMSPNQPELDAVLRRIGVTHRAVRIAGSEELLEWQRVEEAMPLCELWSADGKQRLAAASQITSWNWKASGTLILSCEVQAKGAILVIRQFNDGGWRAQEVAAQQELQFASDSPALFLEIQLSQGKHEIRVFRKFGW